MMTKMTGLLLRVNSSEIANSTLRGARHDTPEMIYDKKNILPKKVCLYRECQW